MSRKREPRGDVKSTRRFRRNAYGHQERVVVREFLNDDAGVAFQVTELSKTGASWTIGDCTRRITLDFDMWINTRSAFVTNKRALKAKIRRLRRALDLIERHIDTMYFVEDKPK